MEQQLRSLLGEGEVSGLLSLTCAVLRQPSFEAALVGKAADRMARNGSPQEAEQMLAALIDVAPGAVSGRLVAAALAAGPSTLPRLIAQAMAGALSIDASKAIIPYLRGTEMAKALDLARHLLEREPENIELHLTLGELLQAMNDRDGARRQYESARQLAPLDFRVLRKLSRLETVAGNDAAAEIHLRTAMEADADNARCWVELGQCLLQQNRFDEAADLLRDARRKFPERGEVHALLGYILRWAGHHAEAETNLLHALDLAPDNTMAMLEMAMLREELGQFESAVEFQQRAAAIRGESYNATMFCHSLLAAGRSREAWAVNMNRVEHKALQSLPGVRSWGGESLAGKSIIVIVEGGPGDEIRDACVYPEVVAAAERVTITCDPRFQTLFSRSFPGARFMPVKREQRIAEYERMLSKLIDADTLTEMRRHDYSVLSPDLLYFFRRDDHLWGRLESYLVPAPELLERWRARVDAVGPGLKIGISWRSGALYFNRIAYYTKLLDWRPILTIPGVQFFNLQYDESEQEVQAAEAAFGIRIHRWDDLNLKDDFDDISALVRQLDLVLAPNTTVLELAGALGVPGWYLNRVPIAYDHWRRKDDTGQDRLYPSVRQLRGHRPWDTPSLIATVASEIEGLLKRSG